MKVISAKGVEIDMGALLARNEKQKAVGGAMNARGDYLSKNGNIEKKHEELVRDYYDNSPVAVQNVALNDISQEVLTPAEAIARLEAITEEKAKKPRRKIVEVDENED